LAGNRTIGAPTNVQDGDHLHPGTSARTPPAARVPSWNAIFDWGASGAPTLSTGANKKDKVIAQYSAASAKLEASFRRSA
jgi:hypothetical protein